MNNSGTNQDIILVGVSYLDPFQAMGAMALSEVADTIEWMDGFDHDVDEDWNSYFGTAY